MEPPQIRILQKFKLKRNKKRFELKVIAVLLYAFGVSEKPRDSSRYSPSTSRSRVYSEEWVRKVEAQLNFEVELSWHPVIAVDGSVVKCGGRPLYVWVAVDAHTRQPICLVRCLINPNNTERPKVPTKTEKKVSR